MENNKIAIKNFRVFKDHQEFEIRPLTFLVGPNNSGKSSLVKTLDLLNLEEGIKGVDILNNDFGFAILNDPFPNQLDLTLGTNFKCNFSDIQYEKGKPVIITFSTNDKIFKFHYTESGMELFTFCDTNQELLRIEGFNSESNSNMYRVATFNTKVIIQSYHKWVDSLLAIKEDEFYQKINRVLKIDKHVLHLNEELFELSLNDDYDLPITEIQQKQFKTILYEYLSNCSQQKLAVPLQLELIDSISFDPSLDEDYFELLFLLCLNQMQQDLQKSVELLLGNYRVIFNNKGYNISHYLQNQFDKLVDSNHELKYQRVNAFKSKNYKYFNINESPSDHLSKSIINLINRVNVSGNGQLVGSSYINHWLKKFQIGNRLELKRITPDIYEVLIESEQGMLLNLHDMGYGVSQVLAIILMPFNITYRSLGWNTIDWEYEYNLGRHSRMLPETGAPANIYLEEPESNLHPRWQSLLVELLLEHQQMFSINYVVETHSEYMIRKLQYLAAKKKINKDELCIYYFNSDQAVSEEEPKVKLIEIDHYGGLTDNFGPGFFDEATNIKFEILKLNKHQEN